MRSVTLFETSSIFLGVAAGASLICQQAINARLRTSIGSDLWVGLFSYIGGTLAMVIVLLLARQMLPAADKMAATPWWSWTGGMFGAFYIVAAVILVPRLGTALTLSCIVLGQVCMSLFFDQTGALGVPQHPTTAVRLLGLCFVAVGVVMVRR